MFSCLRETTDGIVLHIQVQPRSSRNQLVGVQGGLLKVKLTSPPVDGAANKSCCAYLAKLFGIAKRDVELVSGEKSRQKRILLIGLDVQSVTDVLQAHLDPAS